MPSADVPLMLTVTVVAAFGLGAILFIGMSAIDCALAMMVAGLKKLQNK